MDSHPHTEACRGTLRHLDTKGSPKHDRCSLRTIFEQRTTTLKKLTPCAFPGRALMAPAPAPSSPGFIHQPALPYPYSAQEPYIDTETQTLHWTKHTATYFADLNAAIAHLPQLQVMR